jgi:hypothetical protein
MELGSDPEKQQKLKTLAHLCLKSIVKNTLEQKVTTRRIDTTQDLRLLKDIWTSEGHDQELLDVLANPAIGGNPIVTNNEIEFVNTRIDLHKKLDQWQQLDDFCYSSLSTLLKGAQAGDDEIFRHLWIDDLAIWTALIQVEMKLATEE